jgi:hypothetical protein
MDMMEKLTKEQQAHLEGLLDGVNGYIAECLGGAIDLVSVVHQRHTDDVQCGGTTVLTKLSALPSFILLQQSAAGIEAAAKQEYFLRETSANELPA